MTADWYQMPYPVLARISTRIINEVRSEFVSFDFEWPTGGFVVSSSLAII